MLDPIYTNTLKLIQKYFPKTLDNYCTVYYIKGVKENTTTISDENMKAKTSNSLQSTQAKVKKVSTLKRADVTVKLYFDANYVCLGGNADDWGMPNYSGDYVHTNSVRLAYGFNPVGKTEVGLLVTCRHYVLMKRPVAVS